MDLQDTGIEGVNWFHMAKDREKCQAVVNKASIKCRSFLDWLKI